MTTSDFGDPGCTDPDRTDLHSSDLGAVDLDAVDPDSALLSRRNLLKGAGASTLAIGLASCRTSDGETAAGDSAVGNAQGAGDGNGAGAGGGSGAGSGTGGGDGSGSGAGGGGGGGNGTSLPRTLTEADIKQLPENWPDPWVWEPKGPNLPLNLHVVSQSQTPESSLLLSYSGQSPGPAIRMRGDETLYLNVHNELAGDIGLSTVNENPDVGGGLPGPEGNMLGTLKTKAQIYGDGLNQIPTTPVLDALLGEHVNGVHSAHVTNLHTHGLHVRPGQNDNGTFSDDIFLRIVPGADAETLAKPENQNLFQRYQNSLDMREGYYAPFEFQLGNVMEGLIGSNGQPITGQPHPPGTHWYHPHSHGSTQNQVASGMAGFLVIEGDLEEHLAEQFQTGGASWDTKAGPWQYRERLMFVQRQFKAPVGDPDAPPAKHAADPVAAKQGANRPTTIVNGTTSPDLIVMSPGAVERWRVLNGSVDGAGFMRLAVLKGYFLDTASDTSKNILVDASGTAVNAPDVQPISVGAEGSATEVGKAPIWQLAWDGITLMRRNEAGGWHYQVKDLNHGAEPQFGELGAKLDALETQMWARKPENLRLCYNRPNEVALADANRCDIFFQAPDTGDEPAIYTVVALPTSLRGPAETTTKVLAHVVVRGPAITKAAPSFDTLLDGLRVAEYEVPVRDDELEITSSDERSARGITGTQYRSRTVRYAGWGAAGFPLIAADDEYVTAASAANLQKLTFYNPPAATDVLELPDGTNAPVKVTNIRGFGGADLPAPLLPPNTRTMSINGEKFYPTDPDAPKMLLNTAEEWVVYNDSLEMYSTTPPTPPTFSDDDTEAQKDEMWATYVETLEQFIAKYPGFPYYEFDYVDGRPDGGLRSPQPWWGGHTVRYPMTLNEVASVNAKRSAAGEPLLAKTTGAVDHPFHIHQNPFWLTRIDVPDVDGNLVNILDEPRWADVVAVPRNGGRVVFTSRFVDYEGEFVNHCHILLHEDNGMMQRIQVIGDAADSNYTAVDQVTALADSTAQVNALYPPPTLQDSWHQSLKFVDQNNSGQEFPGFGFTPSPPEPPQD